MESPATDNNNHLIRIPFSTHPDRVQPRAIFIAVTVVAVSYSIRDTNPKMSTSTMRPTSTTQRTTKATPTTTILPPIKNDSVNLEQFQVLFANGWTLEEKEVTSKTKPECEPIYNISIQDALNVGEIVLQCRDLLEQAMQNNTEDTPIELKRHRMAMHTSAKARKMARLGWKLEQATKHVLTSVLGCVPIPIDLLINNTCPIQPIPENCIRKRYREADGSCNNLNRSDTWGVAYRPFRRILPPDYADGISKPRVSHDGTLLPSARDVSLEVHRPHYSEDNHFTVMLAVWGQFMDHDITATAINQGQEGSTISCCDNSLKHPECFPVALSPEDPFYSRYNRTCMEFVRSAPALTCRLGPREQLNQVSSYLDGSVVYGSTEEITQKLREGQGGRLLMLITPDGRELLPIDQSPDSPCNNEEEAAKGRYCFLSGDARANENLHLTTLHLLLAREHNRIARQLETINPDWNDEQIFQEVRHIVTAELQHITFNEFLPIIIGRNLSARLKLDSRKEGYDFSYNSSVDASITNVFAAAAFRFAHTLIPSLMKITSKKSNSTEAFELNKMLFNPFGLFDANYDGDTMKGAMETLVRHSGPHGSKEITGRLFAACGLDLVSLNIQRGRDHGLPSYPNWRRVCGLSVPNTWEDLREITNPESYKAIRMIYKSPEDIDIYTGGLSESPTGDALLGPTLTCLIADQFIRMKRGDRFWYETSEQPQAFTPEQLQEIRKTSLAGLICSNTGGGVVYSQPEVMRAVDPRTNPKILCSQISKINLKAWKKKKKLSIVEMKKDGISVRVWHPNKKPNSLQDIVARILSGTINFNNQTIWNGTLPIDLPIWLHNDESLQRYKWLKNINWQADIQDKEPTIAQVDGNYTLNDQKNRGGDFQALVQPEMKPFWEISNLTEPFHSDIFFYQEKQENSERMISKDRRGSINIPIYLLGNFNVSRRVFTWSGRIIFGWG